MFVLLICGIMTEPLEELEARQLGEGWLLMEGGPMEA